MTVEQINQNWTAIVFAVAALIFVIVLLVGAVIVRMNDPEYAPPKKSARPSPDYDTAPAADYWRKVRGVVTNSMLSSDDVPPGDLWAHVDCNVPPVNVRFVPKNVAPEWKNAYTNWGDEREL